MPERLDKFISSRTMYSRSEIRDLARAGRICVNGSPVFSPETKVSENDSVSVDGAKLGNSEYTYLMLNKPKGYISARSDGALPTVLELVPDEYMKKELFPAGRLDRDTTGLMIITDDGDFAHRILSPKKHVPKTYEVVVDTEISHEMADRFCKGIMLDGKPTKPAGMENIEGKRCNVTLREGRYHQIKRMFGALGAKVVELKRISMGGLLLPPDLPEGEIRKLTLGEVALVEGKEDRK